MRAVIDAATERRVRLARERAAGNLTPALLADQWLRQGEACFYCRKPIANPQIEHLHPVSRGGRTDAENVVLACERCNAEKWLASPAAYLDARERRGLGRTTTLELTNGMNGPEDRLAARRGFKPPKRRVFVHR
jgi:5-methylcytosine-specific restriction endonuclease McrA